MSERQNKRCKISLNLEKPENKRYLEVCWNAFNELRVRANQKPISFQQYLINGVLLLAQATEKEYALTRINPERDSPQSPAEISA